MKNIFYIVALTFFASNAFSADLDCSVRDSKTGKDIPLNKIATYKVGNEIYTDYNAKIGGHMAALMDYGDGTAVASIIIKGKKDKIFSAGPVALDGLSVRLDSIDRAVFISCKTP